MKIKHKIPNIHQRISSQNGDISKPWFRYLTGVEELAIRMDGINDTTGSETLSQLITKVQEILDAYKTG